MPSYQQRAYLPFALRSLEQQRPSQYELIVQDGGSTDGSLELLRDFASQASHPVHIRSGKDGGQAAAINTGMRAARGDILAFLNSDDVFYPGVLPKVQAVFEKFPDVDFVYGRGDYIDAQGGVLRPYPVEPWSYRKLLERCTICQPACFWRRRVLEKVGYFDETLFGTFDYDYWLRISQTVEVRFIDEILAGSRCHDEAKSFRDRRRMIEESCQIQARYDGGKISLRSARELACVRAEARLKPGLHPLISAGAFYLTFLVFMFIYGSRTRNFLRGAFWKTFFPSHADALKFKRDPVLRVIS